MDLKVLLQVGPVSQLQQELDRLTVLFDAQPPMTQRFLEQQAAAVANAIDRNASPVRFQLPDQVTDPQLGLTPVPSSTRTFSAGRRIDRLTRGDLPAAVRQRLASLEAERDPAFSLSGRLLRYALARHMLERMLPEGNSVLYLAPEGEEIACLPVAVDTNRSALLAASDATAEGDSSGESLQVPYAKFARRFYLPQWVAFDEQDRLLCANPREAEARIASLQRCLRILRDAVQLLPCLVADATYQRKRTGLLGQLVNQGRALSRYYTAEVIATIRRRASDHSLDRGLTLRLPFFDDRDLLVREHVIRIIPDGRILFVPAFVVRAMRLEQASVARDARLSPSTRRHLLKQLAVIEQAFTSAPVQ